MADDGEGFGDWGEDEAGAEGEEVAAEGEEGFAADDFPEGEPEPEEQQQEPKLFWSKWERPKFHIYDYNYGYFHNYYSGMVDQITARNAGYKMEMDRPLAESWAERSIRMYSKLRDDKRAGLLHNDDELLRKIRSGHNEFFNHRHELSRKEIGYNKSSY